MNGYPASIVQDEIGNIQVFKRYKTKGINDETIPEYIMLCEDDFYVGEDENIDSEDTFILGKYDIDLENNTLTIDTDSQEYAYFTSSECRLYNKNEKEYMIFKNGDEVIYFKEVTE